MNGTRSRAYVCMHMDYAPFVCLRSCSSGTAALPGLTILDLVEYHQTVFPLTTIVLIK